MILRSTRDRSSTATFADAAERSLAPDGGLYLPDPVPFFADVEDLLALDFRPRSLEILDRLLGDEIPRADLAAIVEDAFDFPVPLVPVTGQDGKEGNVFSLELFHGPTLAFKDFGARFLARVLRRLAERREETGRTRTVLTATSGDTGAAVAHAFWRVPGFRAVVLYPRGLVSPSQERQFATLGDNVRALGVAGTFDDCQALVKACFRDPELEARHGLVSANSINIARLLAQVLYYFEAVAGLRAGGVAEPPVIAVPSGNFGNLCAGLLARRMGLPAKAFVAATNANATVPEYLTAGEYRPRPSVPTLSNAMDVGDPSNWERIEALYGRDLEALRQALRWGSVDDEGTRDALRELWGRGYLADPHAAVAWRVLNDRLASGEAGIFLATAHPAKFREVLDETLGFEVPLPPALREVAAKPLLAEPLPNDLESLRAVLDER